MFVATFEAKLNNISMPMDDAIAMIDPKYPVVAINSNFGHKCVPGYERYLKIKPGKVAGTRKGQGDRTCFNSALEPVIILAREGIPASKVYYMKCFPSTGEVQVPGTLLPDMSDGTEAVNAWVGLLNYCGLGDADKEGDPLNIAVIRSRPNMINFKFRIKRASPRVLVHFLKLDLKDAEGKTISSKEADAILDKLPHGTSMVAPPFPVRETKPPIEDVKLTFKFGKIRVKIFQRGKINILGSDSFESANKIHSYLTDLLVANRRQFTRLQPRSDAERRAAARGETSDKAPTSRSALARTLPPVPPPSYTLSDGELEALIDWAGDVSEDASEEVDGPTPTATHEQPKAALSAAALAAMALAESEFGDDEFAVDSGDAGSSDAYPTEGYEGYIAEKDAVADFDPDLAADIMYDDYVTLNGSSDGFDRKRASDVAYDVWRAAADDGGGRPSALDDAAMTDLEDGAEE